MCCLYGIFTYGESLNKKDMADLINELGISATERGTDATGLAYVHKGVINIQKSPKSAYDFTFKLPDKVNAVTGHTRFTTKGNYKNNQNNHPFKFRTGPRSAALAHNGVLYNETELRKTYRLSDSEIETDSYIAVQLLEQEESLNLKSIKSMCEVLEGSYCFTILDNKSNLYLVKGNNPLYVLHHKELKTYFYASTSQILWRGLINSSLFSRHFKPYLTSSDNTNPIQEISINEGEILHISKSGSLKYEKFAVKEQELFLSYHRWGFNSVYGNHYDAFAFDYVEQLRGMACFMGLDKDIVDILLDEGFCFDEIEEFIYEETLNYSDNHQLQL